MLLTEERKKQRSLSYHMQRGTCNRKESPLPKIWTVSFCALDKRTNQQLFHRRNITSGL